MRRHLQRTFYWLLPALVYLYAVGRGPWVDGRDLLPTPDAVEYAFLAERLAGFQPPLISIGLHEYPSRYPLAFPLLLVPFVWLFGFDVMALFWGSALFGLVAVVLIARVGTWMTGSRLAGGLAALFWSLHPQTVVAAGGTMGETALVMMWLVMLELARPWIVRAEGGGLVRAVLLGLALGWLTVAKAPFFYWAAAMTIVVGLRAAGQRRWGPLIGLIVAGLACAAGDALYRRWAFGVWGMNGYEYWFPKVYTKLTETFHPKYLFHPWSETARLGNVAYYGRMLAGRTHDFYGVYMALAAGAALVCLVWPWRRGRPHGTATRLMAGWALVGVVFMGLYFYPSKRFAHLWVPLIDLLAAWGLTRGWAWTRLRRGWAGRIGLHKWARVFLVFGALVIARGEFRRVEGIHHTPEARALVSAEARLRPLLDQVPQDAWLLTNYRVPFVDRLRPHPGPTGALHAHDLDYAWMNTHAYAIWELGLEPHRPRPVMAAWSALIPAEWQSSPAMLIDPEGQWMLPPDQRQTLYSQPLYLLICDPPYSPQTGRRMRETIWPLLKAEAQVEEIGRSGDWGLYRVSVSDAP